MKTEQNTNANTNVKWCDIIQKIGYMVKSEADETLSLSDLIAILKESKANQQAHTSVT